MSGRTAAHLLIAIYVICLTAIAILFVAGAPSTVIGYMIGAPIGWTIGLILIFAVEAVRR